jgi:divalent metal cation (Fe/Co/Zn/Cd) transporter
VEQIEAIASTVPGVRTVARVVARHVGQGLSVDMTIKIDHSLSHQEGYLIVQHVKESIRSAFGNHTTVHVIFEPYMP